VATLRETGHPGCSECTAADLGGTWRSLKLVATLNASDLFPSSDTWAGRKIEVRECPKCGRSIARAPRGDARVLR
jgi:endogenous inhibitor of DNA gyrase (YacG/DUF329 family)